MRGKFVIFQSTAAATSTPPATEAPGLFEKSRRDHLLG
jgi:hypothetical protein